MKKIIEFIVIIGIVIIIGFGIFGTEFKTKEDYLRIHIRANSNLEIDQNVKYKVKDKVVEFLTAKIVDYNCFTKDEFVQMLEENLTNIEKIADTVLKENGFNYTSNAVIRNEKFPTRSYNDFVLESGFYDALILELGEAGGDNWWCVVYPPLCFVNNNSTNVKYKSKILEILHSILKK